MTRVICWALTILSMGLSTAAMGDTVVYSQSQSVDALGTKMGASLGTVVNNAEQVVSTANILNLGTLLNALMVMIEPPNTIDGTTYTEVYSFGFRVFSDSSLLKMQDGSLLVGLAPTEVRVPMAAFPVYGITVEVDGGTRFQADVALSNASVISIPIQYSQPGVLLKGTAMGAGFVEGYADAYIARAGVGGQVDLLDANLNVDITTNPADLTAQPSVVVSAMATFLNGSIYGFLDLLDLFNFTGFKRIENVNLYKWNGKCFAAGAMACPVS